MKYYLGIDLGGTDIKVGVIDERHTIVCKHSVPTRTGRPAGEIIADMAAAGRHALNTAGLGEADIGYVGLSVPSSINHNNNRLIFAPNLKWKDFDFIPCFKKEWDVPLYMANDADSAALGEAMAGAARGYDNAVMLTLGTGIGGGLIMNRRVYVGGDGYGSEPGHIVIAMGGEKCGCGAYGCFEAYGSVTALIRDTIRAIDEYPDTVMRDICGGDLARVDGRTPFKAASSGDPAGMKVVNNYIGYLATGIATLIILLRPQVVILGGGVCNAGDPLFVPLRESVTDRVRITGDVGIPPILKAELGNDAGIIGAALLGVADDIN